MTVGEKIKKHIDEQRITQTYLSQMTHISLPKLNLILSGKRNLKIEEFEVICGVLDVNVNKFITPRLPKSA